MNFRSIADLNGAVLSMLPKIPRDVDLVAGIPRSGLLVGSMVALQLNRPLTDLAGLIERRLLQSGARRAEDRVVDPFADAKHVLVVDDSVRSGSALREAQETIAAADLPWKFTYAVAYVTPESRELPDIFAEEVPLPRMFGWNVMHHAWLGKSCVDIDGVLCRDPLPEENDDGPRYEEFLRTAEPLFLPTVPVGWLATARLEKYRALTEDWLARHGVEYEHLAMLDLPDAATRRATGAHVPHKVEAYLESRSMLFIESDPHQATAIAESSGRPVLCMATQELVYPRSIAGNAAAVARKFASPWKRMARGAAERVFDRLLDRRRVRST